MRCERTCAAKKKVSRELTRGHTDWGSRIGQWRSGGRDRRPHPRAVAGLTPCAPAPVVLPALLRCGRKRRRQIRAGCFLLFVPSPHTLLPERVSSEQRLRTDEASIQKKCNCQIADVHVEYPWSIKATTCSPHMFNFDGSRYPKTYEPSQLVMI